MNIGRPDAEGTRQRCGNCSEHYEIAGENERRVLERLRDHEVRLSKA
jgi:hypothetical protein